MRLAAGQDALGFLMPACSRGTASAPGPGCVLPSRFSVRVGGTEGLRPVWGCVPCGAVSHAGLCPMEGCVPHWCSAPPHFLQPSQSHLPFEMEVSSRDAGFSGLPESRKPSAVSVFLLATGLSQVAFNHEMRIFSRPGAGWWWGIGACVGHPVIRAVAAMVLGNNSSFVLSWKLTCNQAAGVGGILPSLLPSCSSSRHQQLQRRYFYSLHCQRAPKIWLSLSCHMSLATSFS